MDWYKVISSYGDNYVRATSKFSALVKDMDETEDVCGHVDWSEYTDSVMVLTEQEVAVYGTGAVEFDF